VQEQQAAIEATSEREAGGAIGRLGPAGAQIVPEGTPPGAAGAAADAADAADAAEAGSASYGGASTVAAASASAAAAAASPAPAPAPAPAPITLLVAPAPEHAQLADREAARERELSLTKLQVSA
jgi:pyruvate dehydrogenase E2 component (dihydrolipoamide acetyltransferase)